MNQFPTSFQVLTENRGEVSSLTVDC